MNTQPGRNGGTLKRGGSPGRPPKAQIPSRNELLQWLIETPGQITDGSLLDDARKRFHEILTSSNSSASIEWLFNQLIGSPKSTIIQEIADTLIFESFAESMAEEGLTEEQAMSITGRVVSKLKRE